MCGRLVVYDPQTGEGLDLLGHDIPPNYNAAPSEELPILRNCPDSGERELVMARWGLLPAWAPDPAKTKPFFNARADNLKPGNKVFWESRNRHCLVPAGGFYEWSEHDKQPYLVQADPAGVFYIAGLWRRWRGGDRSIDSFSVITTRPHPVLADIHHRSPVILDKEQQAQWLAADFESGRALLDVYPGELEKYPVNPRMVNNARNKTADCLVRM